MSILPPLLRCAPTVFESENDPILIDFFSLLMHEMTRPFFSSTDLSVLVLQYSHIMYSQMLHIHKLTGAMFNMAPVTLSYRQGLPRIA